MKLLLASSSPRRQELLASLGLQFSVVKIDCDESYPKKLKPNEIAPYVAQLKAEAYEELAENEVLLTSDTIVALGKEILHKPKDYDDAFQMLKKLSGTTHQVYTGICIKTYNKTFTTSDCADVEFAELSDEEIDYYVTNYKPFDKAGSYGVQEWIGMSKISKITGSYYTIMGLPTHLVYSVLKNFEFD